MIASVYRRTNYLLLDSKTSAIGNSGVIKADDRGVQRRTLIEDNAENARIYMAEACCPSVH